MKIIQIKKKSGGFRTVYVQGPMEKHCARKLAEKLNATITYGLDSQKLNHIHGFRKGCNPVTNALAHWATGFVLQMDLKDFFDHCTPKLISNGLLHCQSPNVPKQWMAQDLVTKADELANYACVDGAARQGLSSSPAAANVAAMPMDTAIIHSLPHSVRYTRYADDLTFSCLEIEPLLKIRDWVPGLAKLYGQEVNPKKTRIQSAKHGRVSITGVAIDLAGAHPTRRDRRKLRAAKHRAEKQPIWYNEAIAKGCAEWCSMKLPK